MGHLSQILVISPWPVEPQEVCPGTQRGSQAARARRTFREARTVSCPLGPKSQSWLRALTYRGLDSGSQPQGVREQDRDWRKQRGPQAGGRRGWTGKHSSGHPLWGPAPGSGPAGCQLLCEALGADLSPRPRKDRGRAGPQGVTQDCTARWPSSCCLSLGDGLTLPSIPWPSCPHGQPPGLQGAGCWMESWPQFCSFSCHCHPLGPLSS